MVARYAIPYHCVERVESVSFVEAGVLGSLQCCEVYAV